MFLRGPCSPSQPQRYSISLQFTLTGFQIAPRRSLGALLVLFPMFFVSADMFAMLLWGELSCMWIQQYINGIYAVWLLAFAIMEASVCCCVLFHP
jgi:hypothetical protein